MHSRGSGNYLWAGEVDKWMDACSKLGKIKTGVLLYSLGPKIIIRLQFKICPVNNQMTRDSTQRRADSPDLWSNVAQRQKNNNLKIETDQSLQVFP